MTELQGLSLGFSSSHLLIGLYEELVVELELLMFEVESVVRLVLEVSRRGWYEELDGILH